MFSSNQDKFNEMIDDNNPVVVGAVSAAAGIAIGTAAAMYFSKKDNRKKLLDSLEDFRGRAQDAIKKLVTETEDTAKRTLKDTKHSRAAKSLSL